MSELQSGWAKVSLAELGSWGSGGTPERSNTQFYSNGTIPWLVIGDLNDGVVTEAKTYITEEGFRNSSAKLLPPGTLLVAMYGSIGKLGITGIECATNQAIAFCIPNQEIVNLRYLFHALGYSKESLLSKGKGVAQQNISQATLKAHQIPLAPRKEQDQIAERLDALIEEVNACRELLDRALSSLTRLRQSVLYSATAGELTKEWRNEHIALSSNHDNETPTGFKFSDAEHFADFRFPACWEVARLGDVAAIGSGVTKDSKKQDRTDEELPYLRVANVQRGFLDLRQIKTIRVPHRKVKELLLQPGDILFNEGGDIDKLGRGWVWNGEIENCTFQNHVFRVRLKDKTFEPKFFSWYGNSRASNYFLSVGKQTTNLASINKAVLSALPVVIPSPEEQQEIVHRVESLLADIARMEELCQNVYAKIKQLIADLLDKAFRGELVRQNPDNESASILLARILSERIDQSPNARTALTKKKATMKKFTAKSVKEVIFQLPNDMFSFEQLHQEIPSHYDSLKDIIFELLSEPNPSITQFFDDSEKAMFFVRGNL